MNELRQKALDFATKAHEGQTRRDGTPYINHPIAVAEIAFQYLNISLDDYDQDILYSVAIAHDILEDVSSITFSDIEYALGKPVAKYVDLLTKKPGENYLDAVLRAKSGIYSRIVKIADNIHNMSDLKEGSLKDKYRLSKYILEN